MKKKIIVMFGLMISVFMFFSDKPVKADTMGGYEISSVKAPNQIGTSDYYNLLMKPGQRQTIYTDIINYTNEESVFKVQVNPAFTSDGGAIDYTRHEGKLDSSMPFDIREAVKTEKTEYVVPPKGKTRVAINIAMPNKTFEGRVIGGLFVQKKTKEPKISSSKEVTSAKIKTQIAYTYGIILQLNQNKIEPDLKYLKTEPSSVNKAAVMQLGFQNPSATIIPNLIFKTVVKKDGEKYIENTSNRYQVAPNTNFHVNLGLDGQPIEPGKYTVKVTATSGPFYKWEFSDKFTIKPQKAEEVNKNSIFPTKKGINIWLILTIVLATTLIGFIIFLLLKNKKDKEKEQAKMD